MKYEPSTTGAVSMVVSGMTIKIGENKRDKY
jgi:hypothetical protein